MTDEAFVIAFNRALEHFGLTDQQAGDLLHVSQTGIARWKQGKNLPFHMLRLNVLGALVMKAPEATKPTSELDAFKRKILSTKTSSCASLFWESDKAPKFLWNAIGVDTEGTDFVFLLPPGAEPPVWMREFKEYDIDVYDVGDGFTLVLA